jgi:probable HAF family extracellular repeat protein
MKTTLILRFATPCIVAITLLTSPIAYGARFLPLGYLDEADDFSFGQGISADGGTIAGESDNKAYRWTEAEGMVHLGVVPGGGNITGVRGISGDGNVIFGDGGVGSYFQWTQSLGYQALLLRPSNTSFDGSAYATDPDTDISADGTVLVGREARVFGVEAYRDSPNGFGGTTRQWLGDLPGGEYGSIPLAVSANGEVVVGHSSTTADNMGTIIDISRPFYWTEGHGMIDLNAWPLGSASDVSAKGLVVIGTGKPDFDFGPGSEAFRWTPATGIVALPELLLDEGIDIAAMGWTELFVGGISANGRVIVGGAGTGF